MADKVRLRKINVDEISFVPSGDNPPARIAIVKASPDMGDVHTNSPLKNKVTHKFNPGPSGKCKDCGRPKTHHAIMKAKRALRKYGS